MIPVFRGGCYNDSPPTPCRI